MGFFNECSYVLRKSNKDMIIINGENNLVCNFFKNSDLCILKENIMNMPLDYSKYYFDIDSNDNIYGIYIDNYINILKLNNNTTRFKPLHTVDYDFINFDITFPYIKLIDSEIHIIYYLTNKSNPTTILFHHYYNGSTWIENKIDFINLPILDNFIVYFNNNTPTIFYLKDHNEFSQICSSTFNTNSSTWDNSILITHSNSNKIYLYVLKDKLNFYHFSYCESIEGKYSIKYLNGYLKNNYFEELTNKILNTPYLYLFPSLLEYKNVIYIFYIEDNKLYTCYTKDLGVNWSEPLEDCYSINEKFIRSYFKSKYEYDLSYNTNILFTCKNPFSILGNFEQ